MCSNFEGNEQFLDDLCQCQYHKAKRENNLDEFQMEQSRINQQSTMGKVKKEPNDYDDLFGDNDTSNKNQTINLSDQWGTGGDWKLSEEDRRIIANCTYKNNEGIRTLRVARPGFGHPSLTEHCNNQKQHREVDDTIARKYAPLLVKSLPFGTEKSPTDQMAEFRKRE